MSIEKRKKIGSQEAEWIAELVTDEEQFEISRHELKMARARLLSGQKFENWFQVKDVFFHQIGAVDGVKIGHFLDRNGDPFLGIFVILYSLLNSDGVTAEQNLLQYLKTMRIVLNDSFTIETKTEEVFEDGKTGASAKAVMMLSGDGELKEILQGKTWSM